MLSSSITFSVRDILNENQQIDTMESYNSHGQLSQNLHAPQEYYGFNSIQDPHWVMEKYKEPEQSGQILYPSFPDLGHVHSLSHNNDESPYQENIVAEDGKYFNSYLFSNEIIYF